MFSELERNWERAVMGYVKTLTQHSPGATEENSNNSQ
jgi:hypothetical protein